MKAVILSEVGQPVAWQKTDTPHPGPGQVLIAIKAGALNHRDLYIQQGKYPKIQTPCILGSDGCGSIEAIGQGVSEDRIGEEVIVDPGIEWGEDERFQSKNFRVLGMPDPGTLAQYFVIPETHVHPRPPHLDATHAAALPLAGLTAFRALFVRAELNKGDKVLITGAGGGVAQMALQFSVAFGTETYVTSSSDLKIRKAMELGAKSGVNYKEDRWAEALKDRTGGFDVIIDSAGGKGFADLAKVAAPGGRIAFYGGTQGEIDGLSPQVIFWKQLSLLGSTMGSPKNFRDMVGFVNDHRIIPAVDRTFSMDEAREAFNHLAKGEQFGKVVLLNE